jgi:hypothetical protein
MKKQKYYDRTLNELKQIERNLYRNGLIGGMCSTSNIQTDVYTYYKNRDVIVVFTRTRNEHGVWCVTQQIKFTNYGNNTEYFFSIK